MRTGAHSTCDPAKLPQAIERWGETKREIFWKAPGQRPGRRSGRLFAHARVLQCNIQCFGFRFGLKTEHNRENLPATPVS